MAITPTDNEKLEWARCAQAMYWRDRNDLGHVMSAAAALPRDACMDVEHYDLVYGIYRDWLCFDEPKAR